MAVYKEMKVGPAHEEIDVSDIPAEEETYSLGELY